MKIDIEKRDEIFDKYTKADSEYKQLLSQLDCLDEEISQAYKKAKQARNTFLQAIDEINELEHTRQKLDDKLRQRGEEYRKLGEIIAGWASGKIPLPVK